MKTFEELKQEAIAKGIKPGAVIKSAMPSDMIPDYSEWSHHFHVGNHCYIYESGRWATVITPAPDDQPHGLVDGMACKCDLEMRLAIVRKAMELGLRVGGRPEGDADIHGIRVDYGGQIITNAYDGSELNWITPGEFYDRLCRTKKPEPLIRIGGHDVKFNTGSIQVGCTTVPNDIVRKVAERLKD